MLSCRRPRTKPVGAIELALKATIEAEPIEAKIREAEKAGRFADNPHANVRDIANVAAECGVITAAEYAVLKRRNDLRDIVVRVDDFPFDYGVATANKPARKPAGGVKCRARCRGSSRVRGNDSVLHWPPAFEGDSPEMKPIYIVDGARTPFLKARRGRGRSRRPTSPPRPGAALLLRQPFAPSDLDEVILGCAAPSPDETNIGRMVALRLGCGDKVPGWTVMRNCASGMQALDSAIANIQCGRSQLVLAGGVDALSHAPLLYSDTMVRWFAGMMSMRTAGQKLGHFAKLRPAPLLSPVIGIMKGLTDPVVGLLMGQTAENLAWKFGIDRQPDGRIRRAQPPKRAGRAGGRTLWRDRAAGRRPRQGLCARTTACAPTPAWPAWPS